MTDDENLIIDLRNDIYILRSGYIRLIESSNIEMGDGDLAREIAKEMLIYSCDSIKPNS